LFPERLALAGLSGFIFRAMRSYYLFSLVFFSFAACSIKPNAEAWRKALKPGEAHFDVQIGSEPFYPDESRFKGEVTVAPDRLRINITDQFESNVIITLDQQGLHDKKPIQTPITITNQTAGSVMIGRIHDKAKRTGEGFLMAEGTLTIDSLSENSVVIRVTGKTGNFNTIHDPESYKALEGLLVFRKPTIRVPPDQKKALLY
jgi:hypothetical protein